MGPDLLVCFTSRVKYRGRILLLGNVYEGLRYITHSLSATSKQKSFSAQRHYHNSLFGSAFVRKMGLRELEGTWKPIKHDRFIEYQCEQPISPLKWPMHPVLITSKKTELMKKPLFKTKLMFLFLILLTKIDV